MILVTFDLHEATEEQYEQVYKALVEIGLSRLTPAGAVRLPASTIIGRVPTWMGTTAADIRDALKGLMQTASGCEVKSLALGVVTSWAAIGHEDPELAMGEAIELLRAYTAKAG